MGAVLEECGSKSLFSGADCPYTVHSHSPQHSTSENSPKPTTTSQPLVTLAPVQCLGPATPFSDTPVVLPKVLTAEYNSFCDLQSMAHHRACCPKDLYDYGSATTLSKMNCEVMIIHEMMQGTKYYRVRHIW